MKRNIIIVLGTLIWALYLPTSVQGQLGSLVENLRGGPSPKQLFNEGKFPQALVGYLEDISAKPGKSGPLKSLGKVYPELMDSIQVQQQLLEESTLAFQGDATVNLTNSLISHYRTLQQAHETFTTLGITNINEKRVQVTLDIPNIQDEIIAAESLLEKHTLAAAEMHYQQGLAHASFDEIERQKAAAREFIRAMDFVPGYKDAQEKYETSRNSGTLRIIIIPYANLTNMYDFGALGDQISSHLVAKLTENRRVMEYLHVTQESELRAVLQNEGQTYDGNISDATAGDLLEMANVHRVYFGKVNQVLIPNPTTSSSDVKTYTANVKVGERKEWNEKKNREETKDVIEERSATYRDYTKSFPASVSGTHSMVTLDGPQLNPFMKRLSWSESWTQKVAGNEAVYEKIKKTGSPAPSPGERVNYIIEQIAQELYLEIEREILGAQYPIISRIDQMDTP